MRKSSASRASGPPAGAAARPPCWRGSSITSAPASTCFSHYVAAGFIALTQFQLLLPDWRGYLIAWFAVVAVGNMYMSLYGRLRVDIKSEGLEAKVKEKDLAIKAQVVPDPPAES